MQPSYIGDINLLQTLHSFRNPTDKQNVTQNTLTNPSNECSLEEADNLQCHLETDRYQIVVENHKRQKVKYKVTCLQFYETNITTMIKS